MAGSTTQLSTIHVCRRDAVMTRRNLLSDWFRPLSSQERRGRLFLRQVAGTSVSDPGGRDQEVGRLLTVAEACARLRISRWMLQQLINRRQLRTIKIGSRRLIPEQAISELIDRLSDQEAL
jgi:excisionase family DNA binding protein